MSSAIARLSPFRIFRHLTGSHFARNVATVASGTAGAQAIAMAFAPVITRLYEPAAFGVFGTFTAIISVAIPSAALSYPIAIVLPKSDVDALGIARLSLLIATFTSATFALLLLAYDAKFTAVLNLEAIGSLIFLIPFAMVFGAWGAVMTQWVIRKQRFKIKAKVAVSQALLLNSAKAGIGVFHPAATVLVVIASLGGLVQGILLMMGLRTGRSKTETDPQRPSGASLLVLAKRHRDFPLYRFPQGLLNSMSGSLPVLMLASLFGPAAAGFYTLGRTALALPTGLVAGSVQAVFYPRVNEAVLGGQSASDLIRRATAALALVGVIPFGIVVIGGPWLFAFVFGAEWVVAGEYARWLAIWSYAAFINRPSVAAIPVLSLQGPFLLYEIVSVVARVVALGAGFLLFRSDLVAVALFCGVGVVLNSYLVLFTLRTAKRIETGTAPST